MSDFIQNISPEQLQELNQNPVFIIYQALGKNNPDEIIDQTLFQSSIEWIRTYRTDQPEYKDQNSITIDLRHLELLTDQNKVNHDLIPVARDFIKKRLNQNPNYAILWRHLMVHLGKFSPENTQADYSPYTKRIAQEIDAGGDQIELSEVVLQAHADGLDVPTYPLFQADRTWFSLEMIPKDHRHLLEAELTKREINWFPPDGVMVVMRRLLKDQNYGLGEDELNAWLEDSGKPSTKRQLTAFFGQRNKFKILSDLGILNDKGKWSETGYQRFQEMIQDASKKEMRVSPEWLRLELHTRHHQEQPVPFEWCLLKDDLSSFQIHKAKRLASIGLSGGLIGHQVDIDDTITPEQFSYLRKLGGWLFAQSEIEKTPALSWLARTAKEADRHFNWEAWKQVCSFVYDKIDQAPDPELIKDWRAGIVTFEGKGRHNDNPPSFFGTPTKKTGRNDPCPCDSGSKYKKCCG